MPDTLTVPGRPGPDEFAEFYAAYVALVPDGDVRAHLRTQVAETVALLADVPEAMAERGYAPGKWTLKEVILHMSDAERVFSYRMLRIARADQTPLPPFDENAWVPVSGANSRPVANLVEEFVAIRGATLLLADGLPADAWTRRGTASGKTISARALAYIAAGHERHHARIITERYLTG